MYQGGYKEGTDQWSMKVYKNTLYLVGNDKVIQRWDYELDPYGDPQIGNVYPIHTLKTSEIKKQVDPIDWWWTTLNLGW